MKTKIQIKTIWGKLLFEHESENNSTKKTLEQARKEGVDLRGADLEGADLRGADLRRVDLPIFCKWVHYIREGKIHIGCKSKTSKEWIEWLESDKEFETKRGTLEFKRIEATIRAYCAYVETMGENLYPKVKEDENNKVRKYR